MSETAVFQQLELVRVLSGLNEPDDPNRPDPEIAIRITVAQSLLVGRWARSLPGGALSQA